MWRHLFVLLFLYGVNDASGSSQDATGDVATSRIKKDVGANGVEPRREIFDNFRNPVLEYLLRENLHGARKGGLVREIRHSQTLLVPNFVDFTGGLTNALPQFQTVVHLNKGPSEAKNRTTVEVYPALAVVVHTFDKDGVLKNSVTHFQPDFLSLGRGSNGRGATPEGSALDTVTDVVRGRKPNAEFRSPHGPGIPWPFAGVFPIVINDPFLSVYNALSTSMYNAVTSMVEYGPDADICRHEGKTKLAKGDEADSNVFDEVTMRSESFETTNRKPVPSLRDRLIVSDASGRRRRDATAIHLKTRQGDEVSISVEEPTGPNDILANTVDERARSFGPVLVNTPPLSTILKPPHSGYADKRKKTKPSKPIKEEGSSEEVGEEHEEESTSQSPESANEAVAISPPPEGASVAEAKPIGLAIAGPGGVAASKPQGTAVAGPGGLAIARPVGTAIAGVDVEGSVPIGGQQKNKKKPKQEQAEGELHYVGGLTGPIGNPQPKEFADGVSSEFTRDAEGNLIRDGLLFRSRQSPHGYQLKLGQQDGKYGFVPMFASPVRSPERLQKRMDNPMFFHGMLGNNPRDNDQFQNYQIQF